MNSPRSWLHWCLVGLLAGSFAVTGRASAQGAENAATAEALFSEARKLMGEGRYGEACPKLAASNRLDPGAGTLMNLAGCYEKNGQTASAWVTWREAATTAERTGRTQWAEQSRHSATALEPKLSRLNIRVPAPARVQGLVVERDGVPVDEAQFGFPAPIDPGAHPITATAPRKQQWATTVVVAPDGTTVEVTIPALTLEHTPTPPGVQPVGVETSSLPQQSADQTSGSGAGKTIGLVLGAAGLVGIGIGGYYGFRAQSTHSDALSHCTASNRCSPRGLELDDTARAEATTSTIAVGAGATLLAAGAILWLVSPSATPKQAHSGDITVGVFPSGGGGALWMNRSW